MAEELKPFNRVLVRDSDVQFWHAAFFSHKVNSDVYPYITTANEKYAQCIPYEGNEHLLGTADSPNPPEEPFEFGDHVAVRDNKEGIWCQAIYLGTDTSDNYAVVLRGCRYVSLYRFCRHADW